MKKAATLVQGIENEFPDVARRMDVWSNHIYECVIDFGWNVSIERPESGGVRGNTEHSDAVFEEVSRLRMRQNENYAEAVDAHNVFRNLPRVWRRGIWEIYILGAQGAETLAKVMEVNRREVAGQLRQCYREIRGNLLPIAVRRAA